MKHESGGSQLVMLFPSVYPASVLLVLIVTRMYSESFRYGYAKLLTVITSLIRYVLNMRCSPSVQHKGIIHVCSLCQCLCKRNHRRARTRYAAYFAVESPSKTLYGGGRSWTQWILQTQWRWLCDLFSDVRFLTKCKSPN